MINLSLVGNKIPFAQFFIKHIISMPIIKGIEVIDSSEHPQKLCAILTPSM